LLGIFIILVDSLFLKNKKFRLHLMPLAVGIYLPVTLAIPIFIGGAIRYVVEKKRDVVDEAKDQGVLFGSGLIAGEAIMGVAIAMVLYFASDVLVLEANIHLREVLSLVAFMAVASYLYRLARK